MKICSKCSKRKKESEFHRGRNYCKPCNTQIHAEWAAKNREKLRAYTKKRYAENKEEALKAVQEWRANNKERVQKTAAAWYAKNTDKAKATARKSLLKNRYGISEADYQELLGKQKGGCAVCGRPPDKRRLAVDHDHKTMRIRGLLCSHHNTAIGLCSDTPAELRACADYLERAMREHS